MQELVLELQNVEKIFEGKEVIRIPQLKVYQGERIGIVGKNGSGKTTLLKMITGAIQPDQGAIQSLLDFQYYKQVREMKNPNYTEMDESLLGRLKIPKIEVKQFSGGEQTRLRLAELFSSYEMGLILDEPTTHLDQEGIQFLMDELRYYVGTLLLVSHDRAFLDEMVDKIWEVADGKLTEYNGNYTEYKKQKEHRQMELQRKAEQIEKEKERLQQSAAQKAAQAQKMNTVNEKQKKRKIHPSRLAASKSKGTVQKAYAKQAKAMEKRIEQLDDVEKVTSHQPLQFPQSDTLTLHNDFPIMGENVSIKRGDKVLLKACDFQFPLGKRIALTGPNGSGKTSLLQQILHRGEGIRVSSKVVFQSYKQMDYHLDENQSVLEYLSESTEYGEAFLRAVMNKIGFEQRQVNQDVSTLSGGEATRLALAKCFTVPSNVLVLDEPTNFIDVYTIEALESLMKDYPGTILFTSHDHYFVENVAQWVYAIKNHTIEVVKTDSII